MKDSKEEFLARPISDLCKFIKGKRLRNLFYNKGIKTIGDILEYYINRNCSELGSFGNASYDSTRKALEKCSKFFMEEPLPPYPKEISDDVNVNTNKEYVKLLKHDLELANSRNELVDNLVSVIEILLRVCQPEKPYYYELASHEYLARNNKDAIDDAKELLDRAFEYKNWRKLADGYHNKYVENIVPKLLNGFKRLKKKSNDSPTVDSNYIDVVVGRALKLGRINGFY